MKNGRIMRVTILTLSLLTLSGCGATPLGNRNVAHNNTQNVVYTKHGKISGKALYSPTDSPSNHHPFRWGVFGEKSHVYNSPTNTVEPYANAPDTLPNQPNDMTDTGKYNVAVPENQTGRSAPTPNTTQPSPPTTNSTNGTNGTNASQSNKTTNTPVGQMDALAQQVIQIVNKSRQNNGLPALKVDQSLVKMANLKAQDMLSQNYFSHTSPTYGSPFDMMKQLGITYSNAGENIAEGQTNAEKVMTDWMNSPGHRANILSKDYTSIGVGHTSNKNIWVQEFIKK